MTLTVDGLPAIATACQRVTSELLDLSLARAHGHPGTTPIHGHTGTTAIHGHTGTRAHGQSPPEDQPQALIVPNIRHLVLAVPIYC